MRQNTWLACWTGVAMAVPCAGGEWSQFRGPNASGIAAESVPYPKDIGPSRNVVWKISLPPGHSSPVLHGDRIYVTADGAKELLTIAIDRATGSIVWQAGVPRRHPEKINKVGSHAQATPATDGQVVLSLFGESGLFAYDRDGKLRWQFALGPVHNDFGAGSSPIIVGDRVILNQDHDSRSFLAALDKSTGRVIWKTDRSEFLRGYATPVIWEVNGKKQIVVAGMLRMAGYDLETGKEIWTVRGLSRIVVSTPVIGDDNVLYASAWTPGGPETGYNIQIPPFDELFPKFDLDKNGTFEREELPEGDVKLRFTLFDRNNDGHVTQVEFEQTRNVFLQARNVLLAVKPGGVGDVTQTHVLWTQPRQLPYVPSPVYYRGTLFLVRDGGIFSSFDAKTGKPIKQERIAGGGRYYSSPVIGDGKVYLLSERGALTVLSAEPDWLPLASAKLESEDGYATPSIADGRIYVRTSKHLYCFGLNSSSSRARASP